MFGGHRCVVWQKRLSVGVFSVTRIYFVEYKVLYLWQFLSVCLKRRHYLTLFFSLVVCIQRCDFQSVLSYGYDKGELLL